MSRLPKITIVTLSFNQGEYIEQTIQSVLEQRYPDLEYIVIDGGSSDKTLNVLHSYAGRLQFVSEPDRGQSHAINKGLQLASGKILGYLNSDDLLEPGALQKIGCFFQDKPQAFWLSGRCRIIDADGREVRHTITRYKNFWLATGSRRALAVMNYLSQPATFWRREAFHHVGYFEERWQYAMDYDYWLRMARHYRLWTSAEILACFRLHSQSKSGTASAAQFREDLSVARSHRISPLLLGLHALHNALILNVYRFFRTGSQGAYATHESWE